MLYTHKIRTPMQPFAHEDEFEVAGRERILGGFVALRHPIAPIPELNGTAAILTLGNRALEISVVERVIFHFDGQPFVVGVERRAARYRPGFEHPVEFEAQIVMEPRRRVLLNHEAWIFRGGYRD